MRAGSLIVVVIVALWQLMSAAQGASQASESDVKAAYLYQFSRYVEWPAASGAQPDPITLCVAFDARVAGALQKIAGGESGAGRRVTVRKDPDAAHVSDCHMLFIGRGDEQPVAALFKALEGKPTLIAGDDLPFLRRGGMVAFIAQDRKIRFSISLVAADAAHLKISSELLRHAVQVIQ
jgi:hypothetical protein